MKVFVLGAQSNIWTGFKSSKYFVETEYVEYSRVGSARKFDLTHLDGYSGALNELSLAEKGDIVLFLAAISKPDLCASDPLKSFSINCIATASLISTILETKATVLFFSSDAVYEGNFGVVSEECQPFPKSVYGSQKFIIEEHFRSYSNFKILRMSYVLGREDFILKAFAAKKNIELFTNFYRNVIVEDDIYLLINKFIKCQEMFPSVLNASGTQNLSKYDIAQIYEKKYGEILFSGSLAPSSFFQNRTEKISMESKNLESILNRQPTKIEEWI